MKSAKRDRLLQLRQARQGSSVDVLTSADTAIYDEVDEDTYRQHKRDQMMNDDFIVDDDGEGYVDNGADEWDASTRPQYFSDDEQERPRKKHKKPVKVGKIASYFKPKAEIPVPVKKVEANVDDILNAFGSTSASVNMFKPVRKQKVQQKKHFSFATSRREAPARQRESSPALDADITQREVPTDNTVPTADPAAEPIAQPSSPIKIANPTSDEESDDEIVVSRRPRAAVARTQTTTITATKASALQERSTKLESEVSYTEKLDQAEVFGESGDTFKMFWLDHCEVDNTLLLFGKIATAEGKLVSGVVQVNGLCRELFLLPRKYRADLSGNETEPTDEEVSVMDVHEEIVAPLMEKYGLATIKAKPQVMKYAFEQTGIPKEAEYLKILLPFKTKLRSSAIPSDLKGETFSRVFGGGTNIFEAFVMQRNIMGPCWLDISGGNFTAIQNTSHCQVEVSVPSPNHIVPSTAKIPPPDLTTTSIAVQTVLKNNKQEIVSVSIATYRNLPQDAPIDANLRPNEAVTLVRPLASAGLPPGVAQLAQKQNFNLRTFPNEKSLLNCLAALVKNQDPDVFIGHRLENVSLDVLVHRMYDLKVANWSAFGRRNRKTWPERFGKSNSGFNNTLQIREIFHGRLLCDIANELGQSLTPKCQSWDLNEMYDVVCHKKHAFLEVNYHQPRYSEEASSLIMALQDNASGCLITAEIAFATQILSLSKQLTNLAGNAWSHTLGGTRAGRNEYILLHEFTRNNYIAPDKEFKHNKNDNTNLAVENTDEDGTTVTSNKKPKYQGGLVFEPEKGLHKNYVLVMDFNSLYPSIIQEFNICFTTVERERYNQTHDEDHDLPTMPDKDSVQGVLPKLLNTLVSRRREVKKLMKDPKNTPAEKAQYDIKQQALKLTANSMYGCLGYVNSRFYAKPLAMLVTNKGREILMDTRQLAESIGLRVVYGDTDSVMIDTGASDYKEAINIGNNFKAQVNERYKLLEIDIDNVYKRILLHAKKKYAAMDVSYDKEGKEVLKLEVKGLDMRRREYCQLSKDISTFILNKILAAEDIEQALSETYDYLESVHNQVKNNEIKFDKFKINNRISKDPTQYANGHTMPQIQVALRMREQGKVVKAGTVVTYVITAPKESTDKSSVAERARAFQEVVPKTAGYRPDPQYYMEKQIFAPVERLLQLIDGVDMMRVAASLGIDTNKYVLRARGNEVGGDIAPLESSVGDEERYRLSSFLNLQCKCGAHFRFGGIQASPDYNVTFHGITCAKCNYTFTPLRLNAQLETSIRRHIATYYCGWVECDDSACGIVTRQISVYGKRCIGSAGKGYGCKGIMKYKYSDKALYNQLLYFESLFDVDKARKKQLRPLDDNSQPLAQGQVEALAEQNRDGFAASRDVVQKYLSNCGRRYVNMASIFEFMK